jgi:RES domain-containing protein
MEYKVCVLAVPRAVRLVATARLRDPVLAALVPVALLDDLAEIEGATSARQRRQRLSADAYPSGRPHAAFVNAAFAYFRPREMNRFNGPDRGAWYAAFEVETAIAEVSHHIRRELDRVGEYRAVVDYAEMWASFAGDYVDLRGVEPAPRCLHPDPAIGYPAGNALAAETMAVGVNGVVFPSVRRPGGTCLVALWPHAVQSVAQGGVWRVTWDGEPEPSVREVPSAPRH